MRSATGSDAGVAIPVERFANRMHLSAAARKQGGERTQTSPRRRSAQRFAPRSRARSESGSIARNHAAHALIAVASGNGTSCTRRGDRFIGVSSTALSSASAAAAIRSNSLS
jgi:hypothetical protein